ncbi:MAG: hypothetical protein AAFN59_09725 [Pseudomonadota bacterium]
MATVFGYLKSFFMSQKLQLAVFQHQQAADALDRAVKEMLRK